MSMPSTSRLSLDKWSSVPTRRYLTYKTDHVTTEATRCPGQQCRPARGSAARRPGSSRAFSVLTDNGVVFTRQPRGGLVVLEIELGWLGVRFDHSRPIPPADLRQGRTLPPDREEVAHRPATSHHNRPLQTPSQPIPALLQPTTAPPRARPPHPRRPTPPDPRPPERPTSTPHTRVRHDHIDKAGIVTLRHNSQLHHIGVGRRPQPEHPSPAPPRPAHPRHRPPDGELLRELTLDPTRDYQPTGAPKDPHDKPRNDNTWTCIAGPGVADVSRHHIVPSAGFEPATHGLGNRCSIP